MARTGRSNYGGISAGLVPPVGGGAVGRFTDELIWSVQAVGNLLDGVGGWTGFRGARVFR